MKNQKNMTELAKSLAAILLALVIGALLDRKSVV